MTASEISSIVITVATVQLICDLVAYYRIFKKERYGRLVAAYGRAKWKRDKALKDATDAGVVIDTTNSYSTTITPSTDKEKSSKQQKQAERLSQAFQRADQDCIDAGTLVGRQHILPNMITSTIFLILMRVYGTEYKGKILGLLPFTPWEIIHRYATSRGLTFAGRSTDVLEGTPFTDTKVTDIKQAASFMAIYLVIGLSVKFYVHQLVGTKPPHGTDGITNLTQSSFGKNVMKQMGLDPIPLDPSQDAKKQK